MYEYLSPDVISLIFPSNFGTPILVPVSLVLVRPVSGETHVGGANDAKEEKDLEEKPGPAAALLDNRRLLAPVATSRGRLARWLGGIKVLGVHRDDIVVVAQLASLSAEAKVGDLGDSRRLVRLEAKSPLALGLVLQLQLQVLVLEVGETELGRHGGGPDASGGTASKFRVLAIRILVIRRLAIANHSHDVGEDNAGSVVLVCVKEDSEAFEVVGATENRALLRALLSEPHGKAVAIKCVLAVDLELHLDLPVRGCQRHP